MPLAEGGGAGANEAELKPDLRPQWLWFVGGEWRTEEEKRLWTGWGREGRTLRIHTGTAWAQLQLLSELPPSSVPCSRSLQAAASC